MMSRDLVITPTLSIPAEELRWHAVRSGGPGGQNVNKVSTKVELRFRVIDGMLPGPVQRRLAESAGHRMNAEGELSISCDETRSQLQNLERAREKLATLVRAALKPPRPRRPTRPTRASVARRLDAKARNKAKKSERRRTPE